MVRAHDLEDSTAISLVQALWGDSSEGWHRLLQVYTPFVYRCCRAAGLSADDSADVGQEVFEAAARKISTFRRDKEGYSFRGWLYTITRHKIIDHFRRRKHEHFISLEQLEDNLAIAVPDDPPAEQPLEPTFSTDILRAVELVRSEFETRTWEAFWLTTVEGHETASVADALAMSANAVYLSRSRVLHRLRQELTLVLG